MAYVPSQCRVPISLSAHAGSLGLRWLVNISCVCGCVCVCVCVYVCSIGRCVCVCMCVLVVVPPDADGTDRLFFLFYIVAAQIQMSCSFFFHWFCCVSKTAYQRLARLDYIGINVLIIGSKLPILHYLLAYGPLGHQRVCVCVCVCLCVYVCLCVCLYVCVCEVF
jgi:predicted membrane channel-forming protein YqfA (hemolysin III family)